MKIKKITSLLLSMSIIFGMVNIGTVYAMDNSWDVSEAQDGSVMATYDEATETLTISGEGKMMDYGNNAEIFYPPYYVRENKIKKVVFQGGVQNVAAGAFNAPYLATVEIGDSVTSIGENAFSGCPNLSSVTMGKGLKSIGEHVFNSDTSLTSIELPAGLESIGGSAFQNCNYLTSISIPDSVRNIEPHAFAMCNSLPSIKLPDNLNSIGDYALQRCEKLDTFTWRAYPATFGSHTFGWGVNSYSGESTDMGSAVEGPKTAYIDARNTELKTKLEDLGYTIIDSPIEATPDTPSTDLDASNQHPVDENGNGTTKIEITTEPLQMTVTVPVVLPVYFNVKGEATVASNARIVNKSAAPINVTAYNVEAQSGWSFVDTDHDFSKDKAGTKNFSLTVSNNVMDMIAGHDELPFQYDSKISGQKTALADALIGNVVWIVDWAEEEASPEPTYTDFTITAENRDMVGYTGEGRQDLVIPATFEKDGVNYKVVSIGDGAFKEEFALASIVIPDGVKSIGDNAFKYCELDSITIPNSVNIIGNGAFEGCPCLASITYNGNTYSTVDEFKTPFIANGNIMMGAEIEF